jgi:hypothetical protein
MEINEQNYDYLKNQVKYAGFGENIGQELKDKMGQQQAEFTIAHQTKFGNDELDSTLHFKKSKESALYFFNSFEIALKQASAENILKQTYFVGKENNLTLKERYNMLNDRAVFKEFNRLEKVGEGESARYKATDETYKSWAVLNFKETDTKGNFLVQKVFWDHEKVLSRFPVKELEDAYDKSRLIASLEKGNLQRVTLIQDGQEQKVSISANPRNKTFNFYDSNMQPLAVKDKQHVKLTRQEQHTPQWDSQSVEKENQKQAVDNKPENSKKTPRKRRQAKIS